MSAPSDMPVVIAGGGPVGLILALELGRRGVRSLLVERDEGTGTEFLAKADFLNERSMEYLRQLGVSDEVINSGFPDDVSRDTVFCTALNGFFIGRDPMPSTRDRVLPEQCVEMHRRCPQFWFDPLMARAVERQGMAEISYGTELASFCQDAAGVTCELKRSDGRLQGVRAQYLIGCDGLASGVRKALGVDFSGDQLGYSVSVVVKADDLAHYHALGMGERYMFVSPEGTWANMTSVDGRSLYRFTVVGSEERLDPAQLDMAAMVRRAIGRDDVPFELMRVLPWRRSQFAADSFCEGRVFLAGDAAHTMSPTGGHGLNTGLGDVMDLGWMLQALLEGWGGPGLKDAYTAERRPVAIRNGSSATRNYAVWVQKEGRERVLDSGPQADVERRDLGEKMAASLKQEFHSLGVAMGYSYDGSPIIAPDGSPPPPDDPSVCVQTARPGHRAPHAWLKDGRSTLDLFGGGFVLLRFGSDAPDAQGLVEASRKVGLPLERLTLDEPEVAALYKHRLVLVRPDGMVAWRDDAPPTDPVLLIDRVRGAAVAALDPSLITTGSAAPTGASQGVLA